LAARKRSSKIAGAAKQKQLIGRGTNEDQALLRADKLGIRSGAARKAL